MSHKIRSLSVLFLVAIALAGCTEPASTGDGTDDGAGDGSGDGNGGGGGSQHTVSMLDNRFSPAELEVSVGDTVTWTNDGDLPHTVTAEDGSFDSANMASGDTFSHTFEEAGTFDYMCAYHSGMAGELIVS